MSFKRTSLFVAIELTLLLLAKPSFGQGPLGMQLFAPADVSTFGGEIEPNEGYFFQFDVLYWNFSGPSVSPVGAPGLTRNVFNFNGPNTNNPLDPNNLVTQSNSLDTSNFGGYFSFGERYEFGRVEDRNGWFCSIFRTHDDPTINYPSANVVFNDPQNVLRGPIALADTTAVPPTLVRELPVTFSNVTLMHGFNTWSVELMYLHRNLTRHGGGTFEWFIGPRFLYIEDTFGVTTGTDSADGVVPSFMGGSSWGAQAKNNIIGGEIGLRWFKKQGRWMFSTEGRFMAGLNRQNINVQSNLVRNLTPGGSTATNPLYLNSTAASHSAYATEFSPAVELRLEGRYQFTRALSFHAGWTGIWVDNIARGTSVIDYTVSSTGVGYSVPAMGVDMSGNKQNLIMNGLTLGFDFNR